MQQVQTPPGSVENTGWMNFRHPQAPTPTIVGEWIAEVKLARKAAEIALRPKTSDGRLTKVEIKQLVTQLKGIVAVLPNADPEDRKAVCSELNLAIVYHDNGRMQVTAGPDACTDECVGGATSTRSTRAPWTAELATA